MSNDQLTNVTTPFPREGYGDGVSPFPREGHGDGVSEDGVSEDGTSADGLPGDGTSGVLTSLFTTFFRIGLFTIGGGYAMIPLIEAKVVDEKRWIERQELLDLIAVAQSCPGIFAINIGIFIGYKLRGKSGAIVATLGTALPSFLIILAIALCFQQFRDNPYVERIFRGIRPAVVALIAAPVFKMAQMAKISRYNIWIPILATVLIWLLGVSPIYVILFAGIGGYVYGQIKDDKL